MGVAGLSEFDGGIRAGGGEGIISSGETSSGKRRSKVSLDGGTGEEGGVSDMVIISGAAGCDGITGWTGGGRGWGEEPVGGRGLVSR